MTAAERYDEAMAQAEAAAYRNDDLGRSYLRSRIIAAIEAAVVGERARCAAIVRTMLSPDCVDAAEAIERGDEP